MGDKAPFSIVVFRLLNLDEPEIANNKTQITP
jgi:hypothetical protein